MLTNQILLLHSTSIQESQYRLAGGPIESTLHIAPWCDCESVQAGGIGVAGGEGVMLLCHTTH